MSQLSVGFVSIYDVLDKLLLNVITRLSELSEDSFFSYSNFFSSYFTSIL